MIRIFYSYFLFILYFTLYLNFTFLLFDSIYHGLSYK